MKPTLTKAQRYALAELGAPDTSGVNWRWMEEMGCRRSALDAIVARGLAQTISTPTGNLWFITPAGRALLARSHPMRMGGVHARWFGYVLAVGVVVAVALAAYGLLKAVGVPLP